MKIQNDELIKKWEELRLEAYLPTPRDVWTIGWGHTHTTRKGMKVTVQEAQALFDKDVAWVERAMAENIKVDLTQNQYDAVASWVFNVGATNFKTSTLLRKLNVKDYEGAAREFPRWNKQKGEVLRGLVRRRAEEMAYFLQEEDESMVSSVSVDKVDGLPSLFFSKEVIGGVTAMITGVGSLLGSVGPSAQETLAVTLSVALLGFGVFFLGNRVYARYKAER